MGILETFVNMNANTITVNFDSIRIRIRLLCKVFMNVIMNTLIYYSTPGGSFKVLYKSMSGSKFSIN